jgi:hypothetical protein
MHSTRGSVDFDKTTKTSIELKVAACISVLIDPNNCGNANPREVINRLTLNVNFDPDFIVRG